MVLLISLCCSYAELIADWPVVVLGVCTVLIVVCALVGILVPELPDFSDPLLVSAKDRDARLLQHYIIIIIVTVVTITIIIINMN